MKSKLKEVCEPYVFALPIILSGCGFLKSRNDIDRTSSSFTKYGLDGPLELEVVKAVPEQVECDCGVFTIGFAEHFIFQKMEDMLTRFSVKAYRKKLCVNYMCMLVTRRCVVMRATLNILVDILLSASGVFL
ncbi:hypothetical protein OROMI_026188 [Orobanche minor]